MEDRVPGGTECSLSGHDLSSDEIKVQCDASVSKQGSLSLPRYPGTNVKTSQTTDVSEQLRSQTLGMDNVKKNKLSNSLSFASIMKNVKKLSSVNTNSPKMQKKSKGLSRSKSLNRKGYEALAGPVEPEAKKVNEGIICFEGDNIPGLVGLKNHGNTCFMNAVLQCLSNTELLSQYFVSDQFKQDIRGKSKYNAKKYGTKGELTQHLAQLLKSLWMRKYSPSISSDLKAIVGKYGPQYRGYSQHDAQEFLLWLLDKIHEDLNIAARKKYKANKTVHGRADDQAAAEALANHTRCNNSYVYDLFQALYKSSLTCPHCFRQSNTFDPFLSVSLPIPQRSKKAVFVTVVYLDAHPKQVRLGLLLDPADTVKELRQALVCDTNIPHQQLILTEIYYDGFHRTFNDSQPLSDLHEKDNIYALETPQCPESEEEGEEESGGGEAGYLTLVLLNKLSGQNQARRFGGPFVIQIPREISFIEITEEILHGMSSMLKEGFLAQYEEQEQKAQYFQLKLLDGMQAKKLLSGEVEHPLYTESVERALSLCVPGGGPEHIKILVEWDPATKQSVIGNSEDSIEEHSSVKQASQQSQKPVVGTLDECFITYTQEEQLECDNLWLCPNCRQKQQGTTKAISLWSLPDILIIHLKRFRQTSVNRTKVDTLISFPLTDLDMSSHVAKKPSSGSQTVNKGVTGWSPWRPNRKSPSAPEDYIYDLYGVCNHYGNMQGGHYTAFCKSPATDKWYTYDDTKVCEMQESEVVSRAAYMLFYKRRTAHTSTVYQSDHWLHQVATIKFIQPTARHSQSQEDLLDDHRVQHDDTFTRNTNPYATLRSPNHIPISTGSSPSAPLPADLPPQHEALVGSPSMGSLGLVDNEPMRKVRNDSERNSNQHSSPTSNNKTRGATMKSDKSPTKSLQQKPAVTNTATSVVVGQQNNSHDSSISGLNNAPLTANGGPRCVTTNVTVVGESTNNSSHKKSPVYKRQAPTAQPESFDSSRSPSLNSHGSPQQHGLVGRKGLVVHDLQQKKLSQTRLQEVRVYNNLGTTTTRSGRSLSGSSDHRSMDSTQSSEPEMMLPSSGHNSMEQALNEQKLLTLLDSSANHHPISTRHPRRQLPKTPEMPARSNNSGNTNNSHHHHHHPGSSFVHHDGLALGGTVSSTSTTPHGSTPTSPYIQRHNNNKLPQQQHHNQKPVLVNSHSPLQNGTLPSPTGTPHHHSKGPHGTQLQHHSPAMQRHHLGDPKQPQVAQAATGDRNNEEYYRTVRRDKDKTPERELQTWDYKQTVYLQESCV